MYMAQDIMFMAQEAVIVLATVLAKWRTRAPAPLEFHSQRELNLPRFGAGIRDLSSPRDWRLHVLPGSEESCFFYQLEIGVIKKIEHVRPEFQLSAFPKERQGSIFRQSEI